MYDYVTTKPELEEVLSHAGIHKYIDKKMGKNGKWVYVYRKAKNPYVAIDEITTKARKKVSGVVDNVKKNITVKNIKSGINKISNIQKNNRETLKKAYRKYKPNNSTIDKALTIVSPKYKIYKDAKNLVNSKKKKKKKKWVYTSF